MLLSIKIIVIAEHQNDGKFVFRTIRVNQGQSYRFQEAKISAIKEMCQGQGIPRTYHHFTVCRTARATY
jgi:hypothetical protein